MKIMPGFSAKKGAVKKVPKLQGIGHRNGVSDALLQL